MELITEKELFIALQSMENNKSPGNDGLTKEFYIAFWNEVKVQKDGTKGIFKTGDLFPYLM